MTEKKFPTDYSKYDVIYLADTYGVYKDDLEEEKRFGQRSEKKSLVDWRWTNGKELYRVWRVKRKVC